MRTTLSIDDDVLDAIKDRAAYEGRTAGAVLSDLARAALTNGADRPEITYRNGFPVMRSRGGRVTNENIDRIRDIENV